MVFAFQSFAWPEESKRLSDIEVNTYKIPSVVGAYKKQGKEELREIEIADFWVRSGSNLIFTRGDYEQTGKLLVYSLNTQKNETSLLLEMTGVHGYLPNRKGWLYICRDDEEDGRIIDRREYRGGFICKSFSSVLPSDSRIVNWHRASSESRYACLYSPETKQLGIYDMAKLLPTYTKMPDNIDIHIVDSCTDDYIYLHATEYDNGAASYKHQMLINEQGKWVERDYKHYNMMFVFPYIIKFTQSATDTASLSVSEIGKTEDKNLTEASIKPPFFAKALPSGLMLVSTNGLSHKKDGFTLKDRDFDYWVQMANEEFPRMKGNANGLLLGISPEAIVYRRSNAIIVNTREVAQFKGKFVSFDWLDNTLFIVSKEDEAYELIVTEIKLPHKIPFLRNSMQGSHPPTIWCQ